MKRIRFKKEYFSLPFGAQVVETRLAYRHGYIRAPKGWRITKDTGSMWIVINDLACRKFRMTRCP